jgi:hypothetical protein
LAVEGFDNVFRDDESQADALGVHLTSVLQATKEFEELYAVVFSNANAGIDNGDYNLVELFVRLVNVLDSVGSFEIADPTYLV